MPPSRTMRRSRPRSASARRCSPIPSFRPDTTRPAASVTLPRRASPAHVTTSTPAAPSWRARSPGASATPSRRAPPTPRNRRCSTTPSRRANRYSSAACSGTGAPAARSSAARSPIRRRTRSSIPTRWRSRTGPAWSTASATPPTPAITRSSSPKCGAPASAASPFPRTSRSTAPIPGSESRWMKRRGSRSMPPTTRSLCRSPPMAPRARSTPSAPNTTSISPARPPSVRRRRRDWMSSRTRGSAPTATCSTPAPAAARRS